MATDIKKLNEEYLKQDSVLKKLEQPGGLKDKIADFEDKLNETYANFKIKTAQLELANSRNDKATAKTLKAEIEQCQKDVTDYKSKLEKAKAILSKQKGLVDAKFEELTKDPETKKKLDSILYKRYDRKKKQASEKKEQLESIKEILNDHPNLQKLLKGVDNYNKSIKGCNTIIKKLSTKSPLTPEEAKRLAKAQSDLPTFEAKRDSIRGQFVGYFTKNHPEIDKKLLESIKSPENLDRQIVGTEKSIKDYTKAMDELSVSKQIDPLLTRRPIPAYEPPKRPSWFHPIKRIKFNIDRRKALKDPGEPLELMDPDESAKQKKEFLDELKFSKDEYNSEIVQKYLDSNYKDNLHKVAKDSSKTVKDKDDDGPSK